MVNLNKEQIDALNAAGTGELEVVDPETQQAYLVVDAETHRLAMDALRRQQDCEAIAQGIAGMESGRGKPIDQTFAEIRSRLGFPRA